MKPELPPAVQDATLDLAQRLYAWVQAHPNATLAEQERAVLAIAESAVAPIARAIHLAAQHDPSADAPSEASH